MKYAALLMALSFGVQAAPKTWCFLENNQKAFKLTQTSAKQGVIGFTGYAVNIDTLEKSAVSGSGVFQGTKLQATLTYTTLRSPTVAFFDAYTNINVGESYTSIINQTNYRGTLVTVDCKTFFW